MNVALVVAGIWTIVSILPLIAFCNICGTNQYEDDQ